MTPRTAAEVLLRLASKRADDPEVLEAVELVTKHLSLRPGHPMVSVIVAGRGAIAPGDVDDAWGRPLATFKPCWLEVDRDRWSIERWYIDNESQPVAPLFTGGYFPTAEIGRDLIFKVRNVGPDAAEFRGELVGYGYPHRWPTARRLPRLVP